MSPLHRFDRVLPRSFAGETPDLRRRARLVVAFSLLAFFGGVTLFASHVLWFETPVSAALPPLAAALASLLAPLVLQRTQSLAAGGSVVAACWLVAVSWGIWLRGGLVSPPVMAEVAVPFIAMSIAGRRAGAIGVAAVVALFVALAFVDLPDRMPEGYRTASNVLTASLFGSLLLMMALAQEWLRERAQAELGEAERHKLVAEREAQMLRADRLASLGQLAAGMAHEINNPLVYVLTNLEYLDATAQGPEVKDAIGDALEGARRVRTIVQDLKTFARNDEEGEGVVDLRSAVESSLRMVAGQVKHRAALRTELADCPPVRASETRLGQIVVNLVVNAAQAIPEDDGGKHEIVVSIGRDARGHAALTVRDTGRGIPPEILDRVTEPFFTTKPVGVGTGLGLSVCDNLVKRFGGTMRIDSEVGAGTTVVITIPPAGPAAAPVSAPAPARGGTPVRVLIIDDDAAVLRALARSLAGHEVTTAGGGREALALLAARDFDLVLCDLMMPGQTGMDVLAALEAVGHPALAGLVLMTGGATSARAQAFLAATERQVLHKPIGPGALVPVLAAAVARRAGAAEASAHAVAQRERAPRFSVGAAAPLAGGRSA